MRRATGHTTRRPDSSPAFVRRLGEAGYGPRDGPVGALDLLARSGLPVPEGFVLTIEAHREFLRSSGPAGLLEREIRAALLDLGARTVVVGSGYVLKRGLGTVPTVVSAVREAWTCAGDRQVAASTGGDDPTWPVFVQRQPRPEYTGWTNTEDLRRPPRHGRPKDVPLYDVEPAVGRGHEGISGLTERAGSVLDHPARLGWGLEDGRWFLVSVDQGSRRNPRR